MRRKLDVQRTGLRGEYDSRDENCDFLIAGIGQRDAPARLSCIELVEVASSSRLSHSGTDRQRSTAYTSVAIGESTLLTRASLSRQDSSKHADVWPTPEPYRRVVSHNTTMTVVSSLVPLEQYPSRELLY